MMLMNDKINNNQLRSIYSNDKNKFDYETFLNLGLDPEKVSKTQEILNKAGDIEVGQSPNEVVLERRLFRLRHYKPVLKNPIRPPILIVYALMNKSYIFDLQKDKSWIANLINQGFDIYLIDWKEPKQLDKFASFEDYVNIFIDECVEFIKSVARVERITIHGYCLGSTMSVMYTCTHQQNIKNLCIVAPIMDTEKDSTVLGTLAKNIDAEKMVNSLGNVPSIYLQTCFSLLKPFKQGVNKYYNLIQNIDNKKFVENFLRIEKWLYDTPAIAGTIFKQWMNDIYKQNLLVRNRMELQGKRIDLSKIKVPLLNVIAEEDHLV
jgi:polyhydroxyalkanoate synthase